MVEVNPHFISQLSTGATIGQIEDDVDFPHTGLFKSLMQGISGNFVVKNNTNDFDITQSASDPVVSVAVGSYLDNGELKTTSGVATFNAAAFTFTTNKAYYLLVVNSSGTVALRVPTTANRVANHSAGDTIIAMIEIADDTAFGSRKVQFFTSSKTKNSLSIARDNSGAYTESASITSNAGDVEFESLETDKDIIFKVKDGSSVIDRLILYGDNDPSFPNTEVKIEGSLLVTEDIQANKLALGYANSPASGVAEIQAYSSSEPMVFKTGSAAERVRITTDGKVGIGTNNPTGILHVKGTSASDIDFLIEVAEDGGSASPDIVYYRNSASPAAGDDLAHIRFRGKDSAGSTADYVDIFAEIVDPTDGSEDGRITFRTLKNGAITSRIELDSDETVINDAGADINFRVEGDTNSNLIFADAGNDRVGIKTSSPSVELDVAGAITSSGTITGVTGAFTTVNATDVNTGNITSTANQNLSYEVITAATPISGLKTVVYSSAINGNTAALPAPASGNILTVVNLDAANPITLTPSVGSINNGAVGHPKLTAPNIITLAPFEHITLQAVVDTLGVLQTGHMIISD